MANNRIGAALRAAFPHTIPILAGFTFLGFAYGLYMRSSGFSAWYPIIMAFTIFAGSMEFVAVNLLLGPFAPLRALFLTLLVNARHVFYGISMLDVYSGVGAKKWYLVFGMCDESFSINLTADIPAGIDRGWFMFWVTALNQVYWVMGTTLGSLAGSVFDPTLPGIEFVMTSLFVVIFLEQWLKERNHVSAVLGLGASLACLAVFGGDDFIIPSMAVILLVLTVIRPRLASGREVSS